MKDIIEKIQKIDALSKKNPSREEAIAAALKVQELLKKYHLTADDIAPEEPTETIYRIEITQPSEGAWKDSLAVIVADNLCCRVYRKGKRLVFMGTYTDVRAALDLYIYLEDYGTKTADRSYRRRYYRRQPTKYIKATVLEGFLAALYTEMTRQSYALKLVVPPEVEEEFEKLSLEEGKNKGRRIRTDEDGQVARLEGEAAGRKAIQSRSIEG